MRKQFVSLVFLCALLTTIDGQCADTKRESPAKQELCVLSGMLHRPKPKAHHKDQEIRYFLHTDGIPPKSVEIRGRLLKKIEDGQRILVKGHFRTHLFHSGGQKPDEWQIWMEVVEVKTLPKLSRQGDVVDLRESLTHAWHEVQALDHPILSDAATVEPSFEQDTTGLRSAGVRFIKNAVWRPKAARPGPVDATQPYIWVSVSLWRKSSDAQPTVRSRGLHVGNTDYAVDLWVEASDSMLADRIQAILGNAFNAWYDSPVSPSVTPPESNRDADS